MIGQAVVVPESGAPASNGDIAIRLQQLITGWRGAERNEPLAALHQLCLAAVGPGGRHLLPAGLLAVDQLDETALSVALRRQRGLGQGVTVRFRVRVSGRFDAALVPVGSAGAAADRWLLALDTGLALREQVALYAHAVGHLLLSREERVLGQYPHLDPRSGYTHVDVLAELRLVESLRNPLDRRVIEAYPLLSELLGRREEPPAVLGVAATELRQRLASSGWRGHLVEAPYIFTAGRVIVGAAQARRGTRLRADALLRYEASLPIALVQTLRSGETRAEAEHRLIEYARSRLALPFAYLLDDEAVHEFDWTATAEPARATLARIPGRDKLWARWTTALGLTDERAAEALRYPYQTGGPSPRYYQEAAINRTAVAVLQSKQGRREPRILLTMATGTGKTKVAFQLIWKLKRGRAIRNVLYLTDRDYLLGQAMDNEFAPFGHARHRILGEINTSRDILFATYQAIAADEVRSGLFRDYPRDFFDLIIVDECHRGSADDESNWRRILEHFSGAVQIGMTATPRRDANVETYSYFGAPLYTYSLRAGITDGFLAPYRVRRILIGAVAEAAVAELTAEPAGGPGTGNGLASLPAATAGETAAGLVERTDVIAQHLADYLRRTDPLAKTIVFCVDQAHAEQMRLALEQTCAEEVAKYPGYVERIVSDEGADGRRALGRFSTPGERTPVIVTTSKLLSTGVDMPTCKNIVLTKPIHNIIEFKQIIGRGTRVYEPDKLWFTILDYAGASALFFDPDFDGDPEVVEVEPLIPREPAPVPAGVVGGDGTETGANTDGPVDAGLAVQANGGTDETQGGTIVADGVGQYVASGEEEPLPESPALLTGDAIAGADLQPDVAAQGGTTVVGRGAAVASAESLFESANDCQTTAPAGGTLPGYRTEPPANAATIVRPRDHRSIRVLGEIVWELGPDGRTLRTLSYRDYAAATLKDLVTTPVDLRSRWLRREQRKEIRARLEDEGVDLVALATALRLPEVDPFDLLLSVAFGEQVLTRRERADRVRRERSDFFVRYNAPARAILETILDKYVAGEAADVADTQLLRVPPLSEQGTFIELARSFGSGAQVRAALQELQTLLYSA